jgi:hypothetical protein
MNRYSTTLIAVVAHVAMALAARPATEARPPVARPPLAVVVARFSARARPEVASSHTAEVERRVSQLDGVKVVAPESAGANAVLLDGNVTRLARRRASS